jgi:FlaA1/EpsC-like NDP-sugar epimerase
MIGALMNNGRKRVSLISTGAWQRNLSGIFIDIFSWVIATPIAVLIRFDGEWKLSDKGDILFFILFGTALNLLFALILRFNWRSEKFSSIEQLILMFFATASTALVLLLVRIIIEYPSLPRSIPILSAIIALLIQIGARIVPSKGIRNTQLQNPNLQKVIIYGAGRIGYQLAEQLLDYRDIYTLIGFIDDDYKKSGSKILGDKVIGSVSDLPKIFNFFKPAILIIAISNLEPDKLEHIRQVCSEYKVEVRIVPSEDEIISGIVQLSDVESLDEEEILGRPQALKENPVVVKLLENSRVLVTGAAGSIGSEIVRQLHKYKTGEVFLLDRDENGLLRIKLDLNPKSDLTDRDVILGDIRDEKHMNEIMQKIRPDIVFHAAALKHVSTLERFPDEAIKTNVEGTKNIWKAALSCNVPFFVNISSDKAADPATQLGKSKLYAERIIASTPDQKGIKKYLSVRFGNVIGSNGSFVEIFRRQIEKGGPLTVRNPDVTRYFMTVKEAVHLVFESLVVGNNKETLILDMGKPIKILDVAHQMIRASGQKIEILFTGLRPGEKLHETLYAESENVQIRNHPKIMHTSVKPLEEIDY